MKPGSALLDYPAPGGYIVEQEHFLVEHAPIQESSAGTVIVEARRHLLDSGEMTTSESKELGEILHRLLPAVKSATGVQRVYYLALMERAAHFHLWLVPKKDIGDLRGVDYIGSTTSPHHLNQRSRGHGGKRIRAELDRSPPS